MKDGTHGAKSKLTILIGDRTNLCGGGALRKNATYFGLDMLSGEEQFHPGTFTQHVESVPGQADAFAGKVDESCAGEGRQCGAETATFTTQTTTG